MVQSHAKPAVLSIELKQREERPGNHGLPVGEFAIQFGLQRLMLEMHLAGEDLGIAGTHVAKLTHTDPGLILHGRAEDAAGEGAGSVELAAASGGVQHGAGRIGLRQIRKAVPCVVLFRAVLLKAFFFAPASFWTESSTSHIAGKVWAQDSGEIRGSRPNGGRTRRIRIVKGTQSGAKTLRIKRGDAENPMAAGRTPWPAGEPAGAMQGASALCGVGQRAIHNLYKLCVTLRKHGSILTPPKPVFRRLADLLTR